MGELVGGTAVLALASVVAMLCYNAQQKGRGKGQGRNVKNHEMDDDDDNDWDGIEGECNLVYPKFTNELLFIFRPTPRQSPAAVHSHYGLFFISPIAGRPAVL